MFKTKKQLEKEKDILKRQIEHMLFEWNKEKTLIDKEKFISQKVDMVIGGIDMTKHKEIHRPLCNLTLEEASLIAEKCRDVLSEKKINVKTNYHWRDFDKVFVIDVELIE